ncbi:MULTISPECIES: molybdate ABC transporter substrate-binding protein [Acinetobacter]|uniref:Molybdate ABC transporter, periplasmic molybdate-binding protein n=1 Tax=Acinetobacter parvus DSM 16617 = CIP 108168 TaxID=981333 RepID=N8QE12_9GAMM|nr:MULTISPECIES: molybdate ABC transporter substrate-binding protein [Acinetobacter]ENU37001.1 molybdate ABC transporter, periplasmic molybdate-binding protein [Acinetobacter parvus DSM 16617 = CIP 108168]ENU84773.1 molybdate ABC transporter, periplasmic molybdate-binding protein [Acinetobacter sp. CIP 102159]ENU97169.1 molybdate ABC transporter, periplasmic molybdate-binding protein [Acinetobacter sp. CIP 102082]MCU4394902.1 molybdate ABC transporter substrate-binding protein [Acinetobacter pa
MKKTILVSIALCSISSSNAGSVKLFAAASLSNTLTEIAQIYEKQNPKTNIVLILGASSSLAKQVEAGANSDIFFSADLDWVNYLIKKKKIQAHSAHPILTNELVVISPQYLNVKFKPQADFSFAKAFKGRMCTGLMDSVPAGKYAKHALMNLKWLESFKGRIVETDSVRSTLTFVERGECDTGIVYKTDALISKKVKIIGIFPRNLHPAIIYPIALTKQGEKNSEAIHFNKFINTNPQVKNIFIKHGFHFYK